MHDIVAVEKVTFSGCLGVYSMTTARAVAVGRGKCSYTETCVSYCLLDVILTEFLPGPLGSKYVVSSTLMIKLSPDTMARPLLIAVSIET